MNYVPEAKGSPIYHETFYDSDFLPVFNHTKYGDWIKAPDSPYVAAAGRKQLYFIDTRFRPDTAAHIKEQIERASIPDPNQYLWLDDITVTAELRNTADETVFKFDPPYARVMFAADFNRINPDLDLPEHSAAGDWEVTYDPETSQRITPSLLSKKRPCSDFSCNTSAQCLEDTAYVCDFCRRARVDKECAIRVSNAIGICLKLCRRKVDTPRLDQESDKAYFQRMDAAHWGSKAGPSTNLE